MSTINVAILGLNRLSASVGLALKRYNSGKDARHTFKLVGYDAAGTAADAPKRGMVDSLVRSAAEAARDKDLIVLAVPYAITQATYRQIAETLRPGAVVFDLSPLKQPSIQWAAAHLPKETYMVGATAVVNPAYLFDGLDDLDHAAADLFDGGAMLLMPAARCSKEAVELATDFSTLLGATPHFADAGEHDSYIALTEGLPMLLGAAYFYMLQGGKAWDDARRLTNPAFGRLTHHLADAHPDDLRDALLGNRDALTHHLDALIDTLVTMRKILHENNRDALEVALIQSAEAYRLWWSKRQRGQWEDTTDRPQANSSLMSGLMGDYLARRLRGDKNES
jgi:prephenate dehydrogenase